MWKQIEEFPNYEINKRTKEVRSKETKKTISPIIVRDCETIKLRHSDGKIKLRRLYKLYESTFPKPLKLKKGYIQMEEFPSYAINKDMKIYNIRTGIERQMTDIDGVYLYVLYRAGCKKYTARLLKKLKEQYKDKFD